MKKYLTKNNICGVIVAVLFFGLAIVAKIVTRFDVCVFLMQSAFVFCGCVVCCAVYRENRKKLN